MRLHQPLARSTWPGSRIVAWVLALAVAVMAIMLWQSARGTSANGRDQPGAVSANAPCGALGQGDVTSSSTRAALPPAETSAASTSTLSVPRGEPACHSHEGGPFVTDFVNILLVPSVTRADAAAGVSSGSFVAVCGRNTEGHRNSDNFITAPGVVNGAHHVHDYVGNTTTDGRSTNQSLAAGTTTCKLGDQSTYFWPVLRSIAVVGQDDGVDGGGRDGNVGGILPPASVRLEFLGNSRARVVAMPRFIRLITGDAKAVTNGPANARPSWSCTGFTDRITAKYPICPSGMVTRILDFPSCWDGKNIDSANHRSHVAFPAADGACPGATQAIPHLRMTLEYTAAAGRSFAVDSFPEQLHSPGTDHADFVNVMPDSLMATMVDCINGGRNC
jgi:hypothetical protein